MLKIDPDICFTNRHRIIIFNSILFMPMSMPPEESVKRRSSLDQSSRALYAKCWLQHDESFTSPAGSACVSWATFVPTALARQSRISRNFEFDDSASTCQIGGWIIGKPFNNLSRVVLNCPNAPAAIQFHSFASTLVDPKSVPRFNCWETPPPSTPEDGSSAISPLKRLSATSSSVLGSVGGTNNIEITLLALSQIYRYRRQWVNHQTCLVNIGLLKTHLPLLIGTPTRHFWPKFSWRTHHSLPLLEWKLTIWKSTSRNICCLWQSKTAWSFSTS